MHDIKAIRDDPSAFDHAMGRRHGHAVALSGPLLEADAALRQALTRQQAYQTARNEQTKSIGAKRKQGFDTAAEQAEVNHINGHIAACAALAGQKEEELSAALAGLPNRLADDVPDGADESFNVLLHQTGAAVAPPFRPRQHFELGEALGLMDFEAATRLSGARFTILRGGLARLERALAQFMLDLHTTEHGYTETAVPGLVNDAALHGTGQLPKFAEDCFRTTDGRWLIPTAEVPLTNLAAGQILPHTALPVRLVALTDCYRSEAGSAGRDTRGMLRQHQFRKVEMVSLVAPEDSAAEHERMTRCAETVLEQLGLPYRRMLLCAGDTGFAAAKTFDLEVWLPGQGAWREISSCSTCRDFQARRMNARCRGADGKTIRHVHTLNGSGIAVGRALIAVMENFQNADGSIGVPQVLRRYMNDLGTIA